MAGDLDALIALLKERSLRFGDFTLASGAKSTWYIDCRPSTMSAPGLVLVGTLGLQALLDAGWRPNAIGGLTMGADPVAYAIASASMHAGTPIDAFSVRKESKQHGTGRKIEGNFAAGARVVVVEDVITSGASALNAIAAVREAGGEVLGVLAVVDRGAGGSARIVAAGVPVRSLISIEQLGIPPGPAPAA